MAPPKPQRTFSHESTGSLSDEEVSTSMWGKTHKAPQPPSFTRSSLENENNSPRNAPVVHSPISEQKPYIPLPDYDSVFPKKRHGVKTDVRWENIIAEVNQKKRDGKFRLSQEESVDDPVDSTSDKPAVSLRCTQDQITNQGPSSASFWRTHSKEPQVPAKPVISESFKRLNDTASGPVIQERSHTEDTPYNRINSELKMSENMALSPSLVNTSKQSVEKLEIYLNSDQGPTPRERSQQPSRSSEKKTMDFASDTVSQNLDVKKEKPVPAARSIKNILSFSQIEENLNDDGMSPVVKPSHIKQESFKQDQPITVNSTNASDSFTKTKNLWEKANFEETKPSTLNVAKIVTKPTADVSVSSEKKMVEEDTFPNDKLFSQDPWETGSQDLSSPAKMQISTKDFTNRQNTQEKADFEETKLTSLKVTKTIHVAKEPVADVKQSTDTKTIEDDPFPNDELFSQNPSALVKKQTEDFTKTKSFWEKADVKETNHSPLNVTKSTTVAKEPDADAKNSSEKKIIEEDPFPNDKMFSQDPSALVKKQIENFTITKSLLKKGDLEAESPSTVNSTLSITATKGGIADVTNSIEKKLIEDDPFPNDKLFSQDPWEMSSQDPWEMSSRDSWSTASFPQQQNLFQDGLFGLGTPKADKPEDLKLTTDDFEKAFGSTASKNVNDPFFPSKEEKSQPFEAFKDGTKGNTQNLMANSSSQKASSQRKKLQAPINLGKEDNDVELTVTSVAGANMDKTRSHSSKRLELFSASAEPSESTLGSKSMFNARVSPSEIQSSTSQTSRGNGVLSARR